MTDLRGFLLDLVEPLGIGDEILPGARFVGASTELGLRLTFDAGGESVHIEVTPADEARPHAARTTRLSFAYRAGVLVDPVLGMTLCQAVAKRASVREQGLLDAVEKAALAERESSLEGAKIREVRIDRLLEPAGHGEARYFTLSPYVGCLIGCRFCYAQSRIRTVRRLEGRSIVPWGSFVDVRINAAEVLARELESLPDRPLKFCPIVSDPYQAVEKRFELTRRCLEVIRDAVTSRPTFVLTRSNLALRDADLLASIPSAWLGASIPTADDAVRRHFEPRAASIDARFALLGELRARGVRTFAVVQPLLPGPVDELAERLADVVTSVSIDVLHGVEGAAEDFADPRFAESRGDAWQSERARSLADALAKRSVTVWEGELPPQLG